MGQNILIADDDQGSRRVVRFNLEQAGFVVTAACDGHDAWDCAQTGAFDLILTDYQMPNMNGADLCRQLRREPRYAQTPIVLVTAHGIDLHLVRLREELNLAAIVEKPFNPVELVSTIQELLAADRSFTSL